MSDTNRAALVERVRLIFGKAVFGDHATTEALYFSDVMFEEETNAVIDLVLEEAARVADQYGAVQTAAAIRALKTSSGAS
jgi:hypothetical protein